MNPRVKIRRPVLDRVRGPVREVRAVRRILAAMGAAALIPVVMGCKTGRKRGWIAGATRVDLVKWEADA